MKQKLGKATRLSVFFLTVAFLLQLGQLIYLMWKAVNLMEGGTLSQAIGLLQTETFVFICMAAMPLIYDGLFIAQSRRKKGSLITGCLVMAAVIYTDNQDVFQSFDISTETIVNIFVPLLVLLTFLIGRRWLGVIISIVVAVATLYRVYEIQNVAGILTSDSNVMCMAIGAEILYGMGIIMGLVGLRKKEGNEE